MNERAYQLLAPPISAVQRLYPGIALAAVLALAGSFLGEHYQAPTLILVLLLGLGFSTQAQDTRLQPGVQFCSRTLLRVAIALLGARIGLEQVQGLGNQPLLVVALSVPFTIASAFLLGRLLGIPPLHCLVAGSAVGICGASAALAIAAAIPAGRLEERRLFSVVVGVTALGTLSMLFYPPLISLLGYGETASGLILGATIHDIAQAAGAGYLVSDSAGDLATITKLLRVALLVPLVLIVSLCLRQGQTGKAEFPYFLLAFVILFTCNSLGWLSTDLRGLLVSTSQALLLMTMAALGMRISLPQLVALGWRPVLLLVLLSVALFATVLGLLAITSP